MHIHTCGDRPALLLFVRLAPSPGRLSVQYAGMLMCVCARAQAIDLRKQEADDHLLAQAAQLREFGVHDDDDDVHDGDDDDDVHDDDDGDDDEHLLDDEDTEPRVPSDAFGGSTAAGGDLLQLVDQVGGRGASGEKADLRGRVIGTERPIRQVRPSLAVRFPLCQSDCERFVHRPRSLVSAGQTTLVCLRSRTSALTSR